MSELLEIWKEVPETNGVYLVSNIGRVKRVAHVNEKGRRFSDKVLKQTSTGDGHLQVGIFGRLVTVHSLVLLAFVGERPEGVSQICHADDVPSNNTLSNLSYGTPKDNAIDRQRNSPLSSGVRTADRAKRVKARLAEQTDWTYKALAAVGEEFGLCFAQVRRILNGKAWAHV